MNILPYEVILRSPHRSSVDEWVSNKTEFKESITDWTYENKNNDPIQYTIQLDCQGNMLNTVAVRASYILPILKRLLSENPRKSGGEGGLSPPGNNENRNHFAILSFGVDPLNWQSFIGIDEMASGRSCKIAR